MNAITITLPLIASIHQQRAIHQFEDDIRLNTATSHDETPTKRSHERFYEAQLWEAESSPHTNEKQPTGDEQPIVNEQPTGNERL